jgi:hypothetical protein
LSGRDLLGEGHQKSLNAVRAVHTRETLSVQLFEANLIGVAPMPKVMDA